MKTCLTPFHAPLQYEARQFFLAKLNHLIMQEMVRERQKEREEEKAAKARFQAQIEQDRLDRAEK